MSKILRGLTSRYNTFVDQYHLLNDDAVTTNVKDITTKLLTYESKLLERDAEKRTGKNTSENKDQKGDDRPKKKYAYKPCGKFGHLEKDC